VEITTDGMSVETHTDQDLRENTLMQRFPRCLVASTVTLVSRVLHFAVFKGAYVTAFSFQLWVVFRQSKWKVVEQECPEALPLIFVHCFSLPFT
jgi:hypothetical protein